MTAAIVLAAGESSRLGFPKQTLLYKGKSLLELSIEAALKSKCKPVMVVLGANAETIKRAIDHYDVTVLHNAHWQEGMASSIKIAVESIEKLSDIESAVILLCDQPFVSGKLIDSLMYKQQQTGKPIVACAYNDTVGVPVLFKRQLFPELLALQGHDGAKKTFNTHPGQLAIVPFEKGGIDIDTVADYEALIRNA